MPIHNLKRRFCMFGKKSILEQVADNNGVPVEDVMEEIRKSIEKAAENPSEEFRRAFGDRVPDGEEFLKYIASKVSEKLD